jgi:hypothetical protein
MLSARVGDPEDRHSTRHVSRETWFHSASIPHISISLITTTPCHIECDDETSDFTAVERELVTFVPQGASEIATEANVLGGPHEETVITCSG